MLHLNNIYRYSIVDKCPEFLLTINHIVSYILDRKINRIHLCSNWYNERNILF